MSKSGRLSTTVIFEEHANSDEPGAPFATPTLARLYLEQGHHEEARRLAARLKAAGTLSPVAQSLDRALDTENHRRQVVLEGLLAQVRANRRKPDPMRHERLEREER